MANFHDFRIEADGPTRAKVFMDGKQLLGVKRVSFSAGVGEVNAVTLELYTNTLNATAPVKIEDPAPQDA